MCCLSQACLKGLLAGASPFRERCKFLSFNKNTAICNLIETANKEEFGVGADCCIKARAINKATGFTVDFASLPDEFKIELAQRKRLKRLL